MEKDGKSFVTLTEHPDSHVIYCLENAFSIATSTGAWRGYVFLVFLANHRARSTPIAAK